MSVFNQIFAKITTGSARSVIVKKNILGSFLNKGLAIAIQLLLVPLTINYLDTAQYGVWLTISSIVAWISYFDVGLCHGFQNHYTECVANSDYDKARKYVSTTYAAMILIFTAVLVVAEIANHYIDWSEFLGIDNSYSTTLTRVCAILLFCLCVQFMIKIITTLLVADQRAALSAAITTIGQGLALIVIFILTFLPDKRMEYICWAYSGIPCIVLIVVSLYFYLGQYKHIKPSIKYVRWNLLKDIIGLGGKFFVIQISMLLIFQVVNIIISRIEGPESVTQYNVCYKYFSIMQMVFVIVLSPMWAAYTDAYAKRDFDWMKKICSKLNKLMMLAIVAMLIMFAVSKIVFRLWVGESVEISWTLSAAMMIYVISLTYSNMYMILMNGIGKVFIQMVIYVAFAIVSIPALEFTCKEFGLPGMLMFLALVYFVQAIFARIQFSKITSQTAIGIWNK